MDDIWDRNETGVDIFWLTMSKQIFLFLLRHLLFDDANTREDRNKTDKLAPIRVLFDLLTNNCKKHYCISKNATIAKKLYAHTVKAK